MSWHVDSALVDRYSKGSLARSAASALELHLTTCNPCRLLLADDPGRSQGVWAAIVERVEPTPPSRSERLLARFIPPHLARLVLLTPGLRPSWLLAVALVLGFAALAVGQAPASVSGVNLFLAIAPLVPVAGVAMAYGRMVDPAHEMTMSAPLDAFRLLLIRTVAVTTTGVVITFGVDLLAPKLGPSSAWLLPALALTLITLALGTRLALWAAATVVASAWLGLVALAATRASTLPLFSPQSSVLFVAAMALAGLTLARRYDHYRRGDI